MEFAVHFQHPISLDHYCDKKSNFAAIRQEPHDEGKSINGFNKQLKAYTNEHLLKEFTTSPPK